MELCFSVKALLRHDREGRSSRRSDLEAPERACGSSDVTPRDPLQTGVAAPLARSRASSVPRDKARV